MFYIPWSFRGAETKHRFIPPSKGTKASMAHILSLALTDPAYSEAWAAAVSTTPAASAAVRNTFPSALAIGALA